MSRRELLDVLGEEDPRGYHHHLFVERVVEHLATRCGIPTTAITTASSVGVIGDTTTTSSWSGWRSTWPRGACGALGMRNSRGCRRACSLYACSLYITTTTASWSGLRSTWPRCARHCPPTACWIFRAVLPRQQTCTPLRGAGGGAPWLQFVLDTIYPVTFLFFADARN